MSDDRPGELLPFPGGKRGYTNTHPPFEPGNEMAVKHGAYAPARVDPLAGRLFGELLEMASAPGSSVAFLVEPSYRLSLLALARTEARIQLVSEWLLDRGELDGDGEVRGAANLLNKLEATAATQRSRLGLDPLSRARLGRDLAAASVDVAQLMAALEGDDDDG